MHLLQKEYPSNFCFIWTRSEIRRKKEKMKKNKREIRWKRFMCNKKENSEKHFSLLVWMSKIK